MLIIPSNQICYGWMGSLLGKKF